MHKPVLILRADAGLALGAGHVMRCLALAQAWQDQGGEAVFVCTKLPEKIAGRLADENIRVRRIAAEPGDESDAAATIQIARELGAEWVAADGYGFPPDYFAAFRHAGLRVLALDDMAHLERYPVDVVINQNLGAAEVLYEGRVDAGTTLFLGPRYRLLRREFRDVVPRHRTVRAGRPLRVLVTMGGADAENLTAAVLRNLHRTAGGPLDVVVLAGAANPHVHELRALADAAPYACEVCVAAADVASLMNQADVAITTGGSTVGELAALRVPSLIGALEANQLAGLAALAAVPFFRAMRAEDLLARDLWTEARSLSAAATSDAGDSPWDADGATRVIRFLNSTAADLSRS